MLKKLIALSLDKRLLVLLAALGLVAAGVMVFRILPIDAFPDVSTTQVKIIFKAPGMTPEEVETRITAPIERELLGIPRQTMLRSQSKYAIADITLDFEDGTDIYWARQQVSERLSGVQKDLPATANGGLAPITTPLGEMFMFTIEGNISLTEKRSLLDWVIRPALRSIRGVADVNVLGGMVKSFEVVADPAALAARQLSLADLQTAMETNNRNDGAGRLSENEEALLVRTEGSIKTLDDVRAISLGTRNGMPVRVGDIATVRIGSLTRYGSVTKDGKGEAVEGLVLGLRGANARELVAQVSQQLVELNQRLPKGVTIVPFYNRGDLVERAVGTVTKALGEAIVLVLVLLFLFLGNVRAALVVAVILPLSALGTFVLMHYFGLTANLMSLGGLAIAIGLLVDAAVVVVENIEARLSHDSLQDSSQPEQGTKLTLSQKILQATAEVAAPVTVGIAIIIIVFVPLLSLQGLEGKLFVPVALTIVFALTSSLLLSLTVIPVLASLILKEGAHQTPWLVRKLDALYARVLGWSLGHQRTVLSAAGIGLLLAIALFPFIGKSFMPTLDEGDIIMQLEKLPSINLQRSAEIDMALQRQILKSVPEVSSVIARVGSDELGLDPMGLNETDTFLTLKPQAQWRHPDKEKIIDALRQVADDFPGVNVSFTQPIEMRTSEMLSGVRGDLAVKIYGTDLNTLNELAQHVVSLLKTVPGNEDVLTIKNEGMQYLQVELDRQAIGRFGLSVEAVQNDLRSLIEGREVGVVIEQGRRLPLLVRGSSTLQMSPTLFESLRLPIADGRALPLAQLARLVPMGGPVKVERENSSRMVVVRSNVRDRDLVSFVEEAKAKVAQQLPLPSGYRIAWGGQFENQQRAAQRLLIVVPVALGLIFLLLYTTFNSVRQALLVLLNIPFALIGGVFALALTGEYLSVPASVGFIALMGIAVLNGLVMVTHFNHLHADGLPLLQVVTEGAKRRLRPVMMTASIAAFGLLPLLLQTGPGSEIQRPLAIVVIGGLLSCTLLTLVLLPGLFQRFGLGNKA
ncbi:MAG: CusA/CzcA family heavy metal efflux RND transporter [Burkholderiaceae bacterium]